MKNLILACGLASMMSLAQAAEPAKPAASGGIEGHHPSAMQCHHGMKSPAERAAHMKEKLGLTDEQAAKVQKIFEQRKQQRDALHEKYKPQLDAYYAEKKKLHEQTRTDLDAVLTPAQQQKLKEAHHGYHGKAEASVK
jgi:Spy/CpxP family protein refolding chaperone